ncbi:MAG: sensor histidine kinase [Actinomycetota bacterium]|nr:sensor histidine kinase [Actinomycetota bacterium]
MTRGRRSKGRTVERVVHRGLVFAMLAAFVTAVYVGIVTGVGVLAGGEPLRPSVALSMVATAVVAVAFRPARERARGAADRVVYGDRATPYEVLRDFTARVSDAFSLEDILPRMAEATAQGVGAERVRVTLTLPDGGHHTAVWPPSATTTNAWDRSITVTHHGEVVGQIAVALPAGDRLRPDQARLLDDLAAQAGLALRNVRLTAELRTKVEAVSAQAADLQASRQRLVAAQDAERRRMEREIHDGAQQQLVGIALKLGVVGQLLERDPAAAAEALDQLGTDADTALNDLRDLARGIFPPLLTQDGVLAALDAHIRKHDLRATIVAAPEVITGRFPAEVEVAAYFCCLEAIQNATKHAAGVAVTVRLGAEAGWLTFSVTDDGPGFDPSTCPPGTGLQNMVDRVEALGGMLTIWTEPGRGCHVTGQLPVGGDPVTPRSQPPMPR